MAVSLPIVELSTHPSPHPFVRRGLVARRPADLRPVSIVTMKAPGGEILGDAFWNARSDIALRRLTRGDVRFDRAALEASLSRAVALRGLVPGLLSSTDAWRVVHAEGDELSGLVVDRFGDVLSIELFSAGWVAWADELASTLHELVGTTHHRVRLGARIARLEGVAASATTSNGCPERVRIREHGVRYNVDLAHGHKTGFFCDQRDNRSRLAACTEGADVLDLCCYTGGFGLAAQVRGGAQSVTGVDLDEAALAVARANANLNQVRMTLVHADVFDWCRQVERNSERRFDVIVVDPPKFIPTRADEETGRGRYHDLNRLALRLLKPGGLLVSCSCSGLLSRESLIELLRSAARKERRDARLIAGTGAGPDHPVHLECPETEYLKALWMRVW